ncbi:apolipoprotein N-acyltransferase [Alishewanella sp. SMS8]|uniref:apolipoprotein N-acyltransferase n=1 Tax=Alishewanella sp. SMS8 TaxID=2994676 RepID=UPI00274176CF|nr:apolipoprotein N-acyltransferase [Alishewanella sp. SMS8]MDP5037230.1 apolipoprotein N-acyltransferase [Alishewanella sp.]MDP5459322.1 apolipoprotein N-acyltransferase [Alishewanella sp. SMS8]
MRSGLSRLALPLVLLAAGALNTLAFTPYHLWWLPFFTLALLALAIQHSKQPRQAAIAGFSYGIGWFGVGISWVHVSIDQFGGLPLIASLGLMALLVGYLSLFPALAAWLTRRFANALPLPLLFAASWIFTEWLRSVMLTGFPWLSMGYSQTDSLLRHWAPLIGEIGLSWLMVFIAASGSLLYKSSLARWQQASFLMTAVMLVAISPLLATLKGWQLSGQTVSVLLVQGNIKQDLRWAPEQEWPTMLKYLDLTRPHLSEHQIIIWPEAAIPQLEPLAIDFLENLDSSATYSNTALISGIIDYRHKTGEAWNNLIVLGKQQSDAERGHYFYGHTNRFSKHHLLPIGEFVPFEQLLRQLAPIFDLPMSSFSRGSYVQPNLIANGVHLLPAICFEIAFPAQIRANFTADTQVLLTVSNDAWFGDSIGPHQHLQIARMRALEFGRPVLRATNNGITASIAASGEIRERAPQFTEALVSDQLPLTTGRTLYSTLGDLPVFLLSLLSLLTAAWRGRQQHSL